MPRWFWPETRSETGVVVRIGRSLHWLGYASGALLVLLSAAILTLGSSRLEPAASISHPQDLTGQPRDLLQPGGTAPAWDDLSPTPPNWMKDAVPVQPPQGATPVQPPPASPAQALDGNEGPRWNAALEALIMAFGAIILGRLARYILADE